MKHLLTAGLLLLSLAACKDRDADPNVLPPATQTGANTAGCLVDGKVWVATRKFLNVFDNYAEINGNICKINLTLKKNPDTYANSIIINFETENLQLNKYYILPQGNLLKNIMGYTDPNRNEFHLKSGTGKIKITKLDIPKNIVCGTFEFDAVDKDGKVVHITDGRFDKKFD